MRRDRKVGIAAVAALVLAAVVVAFRSVFVFGPDGPPPADSAAYAVEPSPTTVQTRIKVPLSALERALRDALISKDPFFEGRLDRLPADILRAMLGLPLRTRPACDGKEIKGSANRWVACMRDAAELGFFQRRKEEAECALKFGVDAADGIVGTGKACVDKHIPVDLPTDNFDVDYDLFIGALDLAERNGALEVGARLDSTLTAPKSVLSVLDGKRVTSCGPSLTATARLRPTLDADNSDRDRPVGKLEIGFVVDRVELSRGKPCKKIEGRVARFLDDRLGDALGVVSDIFQRKMADALSDMPEDMDLSDRVNTPLAEVVADLSDPLPLAPLIEARRPGALPSGVAPHLSLKPREVIVARPRIAASSGGGDILLSPGIVAAPVVSLERPADEPRPFVRMNVRKPPDDRFEIVVVGRSGLDELQTVATDQVRAAVDGALERISYDDLSVTLYQARERIVVGVEVSGLAWVGLNIKVFLTARPEMDAATRTLRLRDVKFDVASAEFLSRIAGFVLESPIEATIEERVALPLGETFDALVSEFADMSMELGGTAGLEATLRLTLSDLELERIWVSESVLHAAVKASGRSRVSVK